MIFCHLILIVLPVDQGRAKTHLFVAQTRAIIKIQLKSHGKLDSIAIYVLNQQKTKCFATQIREIIDVRRTNLKKCQARLY